MGSGFIIPKLPAFDIDIGSDILIENILLVDLTALAIIGKSADRAAGKLGPSRVTLRQISGDYNLNEQVDTVLVEGAQNLRLIDGKFNGGYIDAPPLTLADCAMIRFAPTNLIDTYAIVNWGSQAKSDSDGPLQRFGFVIDCTNGSCVNGTMTGTNVFDHVGEAGILIKSAYDETADPEDVKFGGLVAVGLRSSADTGVSRKVDWQGSGYFRGYVEIGSRLQAADTALLVVGPTPNVGKRIKTDSAKPGAFQPPLYDSCTFRSIAPGGGMLPRVFDIAAPCDILNATIENSGAPRIARLGRVTGSPVFRLSGCEVNDVVDPTIDYVTSATPPLPTVRNPLAVVTANAGVFEDSVLDVAAASGPLNVTTARWLRTGNDRRPLTPHRAW